MVADTPNYDDEDTDPFFVLLWRDGEPSLWQQRSTPNYHAYRFQWNGGLAIQSPLVIRLTIQPDGSAIAHIKTWQSVPTNIDPTTNVATDSYERLQADDTQFIDRRRVQKFLKQLDQLNFWQLPPDNKLGFDGETWILEGVRHGNYHKVMRWMPDDRNFIKTGFVLVRSCKLPAEWRFFTLAITIENILQWMNDFIAVVSEFGYKLTKRWWK
jgi:hypothetical protein